MIFGTTARFASPQLPDESATMPASRAPTVGHAGKVLAGDVWRDRI